MEILPAGILVCAGLLILGYCLGSSVIIALFASLAFGTTAIVALSALGASSPLIFSIFQLMLLLTVLQRRDFAEDIIAIFKHHWVPWLVLALAIYVAAGAIILPRLFIDQTSVFVPVGGQILERTLAPVSGNITQPAYFMLDVLTFYAFLSLARHNPAQDAVRRGFLTFACLQVILGAIDLGGKLMGLGDVLRPIRSASYAMLTDNEVSNFWRVTGGFSEASAFAGAGVSCLAFVFTYWRATGSRLALSLAVALLVLLVFSTSSTAYVALAILALPPTFSLLHSSLLNCLHTRDLMVAGAIVTGITVLGFVYLSDRNLFDPFIELINSMVFDKQASGSGVQRAYWNTQSLASFFDTAGLGIGMGSSRSSSWVISVFSQLGIIGALMIGALVAFLVTGMNGLDGTLDKKSIALAKSARASALASLLTSSISGGSANPGVIFFIALALAIICRERVEGKQRYTGARVFKTVGINPIGTG